MSVRPSGFVVSGMSDEAIRHTVTRLRRERDEARAEVERLRAGWDRDVEWANKLLVERDEARAGVEVMTTEVERLSAERGEATVTDNSGSYEVTFYPRDARTVLVAREVVEGCAALATEVHRLRAEIRQHVDYCPSIPDKWRDRYVGGER